MSKSKDLVIVDDSELNGAEESVRPLEMAEIKDAALRHRLEQYEHEALTHRQKAAEHVAGFAQAVKDGYESILAAYAPGAQASSDTFVRWAARLGLKRRSAYYWVEIGAKANQFLQLAPNLNPQLMDNVSSLALLLGAGPTVQEMVTSKKSASRKEIEQIITQYERTKDENERLREDLDRVRENFAATERSFKVMETFWEEVRGGMEKSAAENADKKYREHIEELQLSVQVAQRKVTELEERWRAAKDQITQRARFDVLGADMARTIDRWKSEVPEPVDAGYLTEYEYRMVDSVLARMNTLHASLTNLRDSLTSTVEGSVQMIEAPQQ